MNANTSNSHQQYPTSAWTEVYHLFGADAQSSTEGAMSQPYQAEEQMPTHDALADVYNTPHGADNGKRVSF